MQSYLHTLYSWSTSRVVVVCVKGSSVGVAGGRIMRDDVTLKLQSKGFTPQVILKVKTNLYK